MNRLIIVGNGFDLAHGLPTGYCDFIDWYWKNVINHFSNMQESIYQDELCYFGLKFKSMSLVVIQNSKDKFKDVKNYLELNQYIDDENHYFYSYEHKYYNLHKNDFVIYNDFFKIICAKHSIQNWVDIENEYYKLLTKILKDLKEDEDNSKVKKLNEEFEQLKKLLEKYLSEEVEEKYKFQTQNDKLQSIISNFFYQGTQTKRLLKEFPKDDRLKIEKYLSENELQNNFQIIHTHVLTFNYTSLVKELVDRYAEEYISVNTIHGELNSSQNPINFGFGDEMDKNYQEIEDSGEGEFLKYVKSFAYFNTDNYKQLLDFIDSGKFQVYIMGHSCGLSDRILLNTIFEHEYCRSIKIFYHKDGEMDNFTEIAQNISRHFKKKDSMRMKIVNKTLCEEMPQMQLPLKN